MSYIINYSSGGLGNRFKPLGSCYNIANQTGRELAMTWYRTPACNAPFESLYKNNINIIDLKSLDPVDVSIYSELAWIEHDVRLNGNSDLYNLCNIVGCHPLSQSDKILTDNKKYVIVYSNTFLQGFESIGEFIKSLDPIDELKNKINSFKFTFEIDKNVVGVHARGTDFTTAGAHTYIPQMSNFNNKFYVCSDSKEIEDQIRNVFKDRVIIREKKYVERADYRSGAWVNNISRTEESVKDAVIDLNILAATNFQVYNKDSSFAEIVKLLQ